MYRLLESIKVVGNEPCNLSLHEQRLNDSRRTLLRPDLPPIHLAGVLDTACLNPALTYKARVICSVEVEKVEYEVYKKREIRSLALVESAGISYSHKFADRSGIEALLEKKGEADDILMAKDGRITDTSYANVCLWDGTGWVTPGQPLLKGTKRAWLLGKGLIKEQSVFVKDLPSFEKLCLINAMLDLGELELPVSRVLPAS